MTQQELEILDLDALMLHQDIALRRYKIREVTEAYCKAAAIAHQLVRTCPCTVISRLDACAADELPHRDHVRQCSSARRVPGRQPRKGCQAGKIIRSSGVPERLLGHQGCRLFDRYGSIEPSRCTSDARIAGYVARIDKPAAANALLTDILLDAGAVSSHASPVDAPCLTQALSGAALQDQYSPNNDDGRVNQQRFRNDGQSLQHRLDVRRKHGRRGSPYCSEGIIAGLWQAHFFSRSSKPLLTCNEQAPTSQDLSGCRPCAAGSMRSRCASYSLRDWVRGSLRTTFGSHPSDAYLPWDAQPLSRDKSLYRRVSARWPGELAS